MFVFTSLDGRYHNLSTMNYKTNTGKFDINKVCRTCLSEKGEMRSVFLADETIVQAMKRPAEIIMGFSSVQITSGDGLPASICMQCVHQINRVYSFKQLCEQSDASLRQFLGKPLAPKQCEEEKDETSFNSNLYESPNLNSFDLESQTDSLAEGTSQEAMDEELVAQRQVIETTKLRKARVAAEKNKSPTKYMNTEAAKKIKLNPKQCKVCKKKFIRLKSFRKHLKMHIEYRPYKCTMCSKAFTEKHYLNNHMQIHMSEDQKPHECEICQRRFIHKTILNKHRLKHSGENPLFCKICNKGCLAENSLLKHMKIHEKKEGDPALLKYICDYCKREFPDANTLGVHIKQHSGDKPFLCSTCGKCFSHRFHLELHLRKHTGERPFICEICKKCYVSKGNLKQHMRTHTNERPFLCDFCGKAFEQSDDLTSHKQLHDTEKSTECSVSQKSSQSDILKMIEDRKQIIDNNVVDNKNDFLFLTKGQDNTSFYDEYISRACKEEMLDDDEIETHNFEESCDLDLKTEELELLEGLETLYARYECKVCNEELMGTENLETHLKRHPTFVAICRYCLKRFSDTVMLNAHIKQHLLNETNFKCPICKAEYEKIAELKAHCLLHRDETFYCNRCNRNFTNKLSFEAHEKDHTKPRYMCDLCGKQYFTQTSLASHTRQHNNEKPFQCLHCKKFFRSRGSLTIHKRIHTQIKPYVCSYCNYSSRQSGDLATHIRIHTGVKPYKCTFPYCDKEFTTSSQRSEHYRRHINERKHICSVCGKAFLESKTLKTHMMTHTGERPYKCEICGNSFTRSHHLLVHKRGRHSSAENS